jgi:hypothetical protein
MRRKRKGEPDGITYLKRSIFRFWYKHPNNKSLDGAPTGKHDVEFPLDRVKRNRISKLIDQHSCGQREVGECHTLRSYFEAENFDWEESL